MKLLSKRTQELLGARLMEATEPTLERTVGTRNEIIVSCQECRASVDSYGALGTPQVLSHLPHCRSAARYGKIIDILREFDFPVPPLARTRKVT